MSNNQIRSGLTRRGSLKYAGAAVGSGLLAGCAGTGDGSDPGATGEELFDRDRVAEIASGER